MFKDQKKKTEVGVGVEIKENYSTSLVKKDCRQYLYGDWYHH